MTAALQPQLTRLDQRILDRVPEDGRATRAAWIIRDLYPPIVRRRWEGNVLVRVEHPTATREQQREVREVLRGLAHLGLIRERRGGWWSR